MAFDKDAFYAQLGLPDVGLIDKRIAKKMVLEHGQLTSADKKTLSSDVDKLTWKYTLKADTVQVLPYEDSDREYLEIDLIEADLSHRSRAPRIAELLQRAIPYPVLLVMVEGDAFCVSVAHKRFSRAEQGAIVAEGFLCSPWIEPPLSEIDQAFCEALALPSLSRVDFYALYRGMVDAVLARTCGELTGTFVVDATQPEQDRRQRLEQCHTMERDIRRLRVAIAKEDQFAEKVELNTRIKELEDRLVRTKAEL
ncbi:hypothetical protein MARPU_12450 [Marichromatium purpuratum 984]|uniref:Methyl-accepting chemotaxis protein n=2 Tax=Marichromatium purpuratum TaxID=37487 RepID=W0E7T8_MARPU|nr:hypothetical protein MARPU_12450 [Marichromatium purpuratum 984]